MWAKINNVPDRPETKGRNQGVSKRLQYRYDRSHYQGYWVMLSRRYDSKHIRQTIIQCAVIIQIRLMPFDVTASTAIGLLHLLAYVRIGLHTPLQSADYSDNLACKMTERIKMSATIMCTSLIARQKPRLGSYVIFLIRQPFILHDINITGVDSPASQYSSPVLPKSRRPTQKLNNPLNPPLNLAEVRNY